MTTYYLVEYHGKGEHDYHEAKRSEFDTPLGAIKALGGAIGAEHLWEALELNFGDMIYWVTDTLGFAVATDTDLDPVDTDPETEN